MIFKNNVYSIYLTFDSFVAIIIKKMFTSIKEIQKPGMIL